MSDMVLVRVFMERQTDRQTVFAKLPYTTGSAADNQTRTLGVWVGCFDTFPFSLCLFACCVFHGNTWEHTGCHWMDGWMHGRVNGRGVPICLCIPALQRS